MSIQLGRSDCGGESPRSTAYEEKVKKKDVFFFKYIVCLEKNIDIRCLGI